MVQTHGQKRQAMLDQIRVLGIALELAWNWGSLASVAS